MTKLLFFTEWKRWLNWLLLNGKNNMNKTTKLWKIFLVPNIPKFPFKNFLEILIAFFNWRRSPGDSKRPWKITLIKIENLFWILMKFNFFCNSWRIRGRIWIRRWIKIRCWPKSNQKKRINKKKNLRVWLRVFNWNSIIILSTFRIFLIRPGWKILIKSSTRRSVIYHCLMNQLT